MQDELEQRLNAVHLHHTHPATPFTLPTSNGMNSHIGDVKANGATKKVECQVRCRIPIDVPVLNQPAVVKSTNCYLHIYTSTSMPNDSANAHDASTTSNANTGINFGLTAGINLSMGIGNLASLGSLAAAGGSEVVLAIVFGDSIKSSSLDAIREGETTLDRQIRGATPLEKINQKEDTSRVGKNVPLVRLHSSCFTSETIGSSRCDCAEQLREAMRRMAEHGQGVIVYLLQEGRGIGLLEKLKAYNLQDMGYDTVCANLELGHPPDLRKYDLAPLVLRDLGIEQMKLLTNNPDKVSALESYGAKVVERLPMVPRHWTMHTADEEEESLGQSQSGGASSPTASEDEVTDLRIGVGPVSPPVEKVSKTSQINNVTAMLVGDNDDSGTESVGSGKRSWKRKEMDSYIVTKVKRMGHLLDIPDHLSDVSDGQQ